MNKTLMPKAPVERYYIDPEELKRQVIESQACLSCTEELAKSLMTIADKVLNFRQYVNYDPILKEEMKSYSMYRFLKTGIKTMDPTKNLFAYITTSHYFNYMAVLSKWYKDRNQHSKYIYDTLNQACADQTMQITPAMKSWLKDTAERTQYYADKDK